MAKSEINLSSFNGKALILEFEVVQQIDVRAP